MTFSQTYEKAQDIAWVQARAHITSLISRNVHVKAETELKEQILDQACWQINGPEVWHSSKKLRART